MVWIHKNSGFTLAEALVTIGIIGAISAMTIPALMKNTGNAETVARVKKAYNTLENAYRTTAFEYDSPRPGSWGANDPLSLMAKSMKTLNNASPYILSDGTTFSYNNNTISVDVNGNKKPNQAGIDQFVFQLGNNGVTYKIGAESGCLNAENTVLEECSGWIILYGNMDYLKCNTLSWDGEDNKKCN